MSEIPQLPSIARWVSSSGLKCYIDAGITIVDGKIKHWTNDENGDKTSILINLTNVNEYVYTYNLPTDTEILDGFTIYSGNTVIGTIVSADSNAPESLKPLPKINIPTHQVESEPIVNTIYRLWEHYPSTPFQRKISLSSATTSANNALRYKVVVNDDKLFVNAFNPIKTTRDAFNDMIQSDPLDLFEGISGIAHLIEEENAVVIPLSDGVRIYVEEFSLESFMSLSVEGLSTPFRPTLYKELTEVRTVSMNIPTRRPLYRNDDIPSTFLDKIQNNVEDNTWIRNVDVSILRIGDGEYQPLQMDSFSGAIYGSNNFIQLT